MQCTRTEKGIGSVVDYDSVDTIYEVGHMEQDKRTIQSRACEIRAVALYGVYHYS